MRGLRSTIARTLGREVAVLSLLAVIVVGSMLLVGAVHPTSVMLLGLPTLALLAGLVATRRTIPAPALVLFCLAAYTAFQAVPLPISVVRVLAPRNADIWQRAYIPLGGPSPSWISISLAPALTWLAALCWSTYGVVFWGSHALTKRLGPLPIAGVVFASGCLCGGLTIGHGLVRAENVYGLYEPSIRLSRWAVGPFINSNNLAEYMNLGGLMGLGIMTRIRGNRRWLIAILTTLCAGVSVGAGSRAGLIALGIGMIIWVASAVLRGSSQSSRAGWSAALTGLMVVGCGGLLALLSKGRMGESWALDDKLTVFRWASRMVSDFFLLGVGRGAFGSVFHAYSHPRRDMVFEHAENFPLQWGSEWGVPVAFVLCIALVLYTAALFRAAKKSEIGVSVFAGFVALALHNLVDLGFEVPAICIALAAAGGAAWPSQPSVAARKRRPIGRRRLAQSAVLVGLASILGIVLAVRPERLPDTRRRVHDAYLLASKSGDWGTAHLAIEEAVERFPAEPYFDRLGAVVALATQQNPMPWIQRALERDPSDGRVHIVLADVLARRGLAGQALLELRLAMEAHDDLVGPATKRALRVSGDVSALERVVPDGTSRGPALRALGSGLRGRAKEHFLTEAVAAEPESTASRSLLAYALLAELDTSDHGECRQRREECERIVTQQAEALVALPGGKATGLYLRARLSLALGDTPGAEREVRACLQLPAPKECMPLAVRMALEQRDLARADSLSSLVIHQSCRSRTECGQAAGSIAALFEAAGEWERAWQLRKRAAEADDTTNSWLAAAIAARKAERLTDALRILKRLQRIEPGNPRIAAELARETGEPSQGTTP